MKGHGWYDWALFHSSAVEGYQSTSGAAPESMLCERQRSGGSNCSKNRKEVTMLGSFCGASSVAPRKLSQVWSASTTTDMPTLTVFTKSAQPVAWGPLTYAQYLHDTIQTPEPVVEASESAEACALDGQPAPSASQALRALAPQHAENSSVRAPSPSFQHMIRP